MGFFRPTPPPYEPLEWVKKPLAERGRMVCEAWALQGYGSPVAVYGTYAVKIAVYVGLWIFFCGFTPGLGGLRHIAQWWLSPIAFQKAILWSLLFEGLGLGCGSGPLTGRYFPPFGGFLYFLRPGTTKLPLFPALPLFGGTRRTWFDVALYLALIGASLRALVASEPTIALLVPIAVLVPLLALADRTIFLAVRPEHFWTTTLCFLFAGNWIAGAKAVQLALWFFAGFSKLNHHFPSVVGVMTSNSPFARFAWLRRSMYREFPGDLRPSRLAAVAGHFGTLLEMAIPVVLWFGRDLTRIPTYTWAVTGLRREHWQWGVLLGWAAGGLCAQPGYIPAQALDVRREFRIKRQQSLQACHFQLHIECDLLLKRRNQLQGGKELFLPLEHGTRHGIAGFCERAFLSVGLLQLRSVADQL